MHGAAVAPGAARDVRAQVGRPGSQMAAGRRGPPRSPRPPTAASHTEGRPAFTRDVDGADPPARSALRPASAPPRRPAPTAKEKHSIPTRASADSMPPRADCRAIIGLRRQQGRWPGGGLRHRARGATAGSDPQARGMAASSWALVTSRRRGHLDQAYGEPGTPPPEPPPASGMRVSWCQVIRVHPQPGRGSTSIRRRSCSQLPGAGVLQVAVDLNHQPLIAPSRNGPRVPATRHVLGPRQIGLQTSRRNRLWASERRGRGALFGAQHTRRSRAVPGHRLGGGPGTVDEVLPWEVRRPARHATLSARPRDRRSPLRA